MARRKELATRAALGASRLQLVRQLVTESLILALAGGLLGVLLTLVGIRLFEVFQPDTELQFQSYPLDIYIDRGVLAFTMGISLLTGLLFGVAPALRASKADLKASLGTSVAAPPGAHEGAPGRSWSYRKWRWPSCWCWGQAS